MYAREIKRWLAAVGIFFGWGFVMHATGLLLHEFGGHALTASIWGCGISAYGLTFFGHGQVTRRTCDDWSMTGILIVDWSGLVFTSAVGAVAVWLLHKKKEWPPLWRLLVALVAFFFLLGQLGYATQGGFHDLFDPRRSAIWLGKHGVHWLAWVPTMILYALSAAYCARAAVDAFRAHFGLKTRLLTAGYLLATLGVAGLLYFEAFRIEWQIRTDLAMRGVTEKAERIAEASHTAPPFPIHRVLLAIALAAVIGALARPVAVRGEPRPIPPRLGAVVALATAACFLVLLLLILHSS